MASGMKFKKILGIDFAEDLVMASRKKIKNKIRKKPDTEVEFICSDAARFDISDS